MWRFFIACRLEKATNARISGPVVTVVADCAGRSGHRRLARPRRMHRRTAAPVPRRRRRARQFAGVNASRRCPSRTRCRCCRVSCRSRSRRDDPHRTPMPRRLPPAVHAIHGRRDQAPSRASSRHRPPCAEWPPGRRAEMRWNRDSQLWCPCTIDPRLMAGMALGFLGQCRQQRAIRARRALRVNAHGQDQACAESMTPRARSAAT